MTHMLEVSNLTIDYAGLSLRPLVNNADFRLEHGSTLALVGESGAGKSLTALAVMGLLPDGLVRSEGSILIGGTNPDDLSREEMRSLRGGKIAMIMQHPMSAFDPTFTVHSHFAETLKSHVAGAGRDQIINRARASLVAAGFDHPDTVLTLYPFQMSGGMLQRVMIAIALVNEPALLIADEATTDLDAVSQKQIVDLLKTQRIEARLSLLLITHDLSVAASLADNIAVMHQGVVVEQGRAKQIFANPQAPYTRQLITAHRNLYDGRFESLVRGGDGESRATASAH